MRDGTVLFADVYRPSTEGRFPVILYRTPYDKENITLAMGTQINPVHAAHRGYVVLVQDVRGRFTSQGTFETFADELNDGYDTVEWAAALPYSSGKVGMFGGSYTGVTQIMAAMGRPPALAAISPRQAGSNYHEGWTYQGGAFMLAFNLLWTLTLSMGEVSASSLPTETKKRMTEVLVRANDGFKETSSRLPLSRTDVFGPLGVARYFRDWLDHPRYDEFWSRIDVEPHYKDMDVAGLHIGGWYDIFLGGTLDNYLGLAASSRRDPAKKPQRLIIGPWLHGPDFGSRIGEWDSGYMSQGSAIGIEKMQFRWFDRWLKGIENGAERDAPVLIYVMGEGRWREESQWPLERAVFTNYYLNSKGNANSLDGDGTLSAQPPSEEHHDAFVYNPLRPVPTRGGGTTGTYPTAINDGVFDQRSVEKRDDVLIYSTGALGDDTEVTGPICVSLFASSSEVDTDFTAKLVDVHPDGYARNLCDGIIRARYRDSFARPVSLTPGKVYQFTIDLAATSNLFRIGHRIRLEVASSNFPKFDRNLNTGGDHARDASVRTAVQTVRHSGIHPSCVTLPIIPRT